MRRLCASLIPMMLLGGCTAYYYCPGKTVEQARQDYLDTAFQARAATVSLYNQMIAQSFEYSSLIRQGMQAKGYGVYFEGNLPQGLRKQSFYLAMTNLTHQTPEQ